MIIGWHHYRACLAGAWADLGDPAEQYIGSPFQHTDPYLLEAKRRGFKVARTIGANERPTAKDFSEPCLAIAWDLEGGGNPTENARWFRTLFNRIQSKIPSCQIPLIYSGYPGCLYSQQTIAERYGCDYALLHREFRRWWGWPRPLPWAACGGIRGPLPANALYDMPPNLPVLHAIASPDPALPESEQWAQVREDTRDRLSWIKRGAGKGLLLVKARDGEPGARWGEADSTYTRIIAEEIAKP